MHSIIILHTSVFVEMKLNLRTSIEVLDVIKGPSRDIVSAKCNVNGPPWDSGEGRRGKGYQNQTSPQRRTHFLRVSQLMNYDTSL